MSTIDNWVFYLLAVLAGVLIGAIVVTYYYRRGFSVKQKTLQEDMVKVETETEKMLGEAQKAAENRKRELLLQVKEEITKAKVELEKDFRERRSDLSRERHRLEQKEESMDKKISALDDRDDALDERMEMVHQAEARVKELEQKKVEELEHVSSLSMEDARHLVLEQARTEYSHDLALLLKQMEEQTREDAERKSREILADAIQRYASDYVSEVTVSVVNLPNDEMKGRIIGREGRNIRAIETIIGVDLIIDDTPEAVILSSFDPIRREIARLTIEKLILDGRIHPARIEEMAGKARREVEQTIKQEGERVAFDTGIIGMNPEIIRLLGKMRYRTSYGQNVLQHSIEVCWITGMMAAELGLDVMLAKRAGLLHDIGKAVDFEMEGSHVELGGDIARKHKESNVVVNAIMSHHGDVDPIDPISVLVAAADAVSAARPGARRENLETYIKRIQKLEEIATSFEGVEKSYAIQAGREIRVMVKPDVISDPDMVLKAREICKRIEEELSFPGQIKVNIIRETRAVDYAK